MTKYINAEQMQQNMLGRKDSWLSTILTAWIDNQLDALIRCHDCVKRKTEDCPMYFCDEYDLEYCDHTNDDGFCDRGELHHGA